MRITVRQDILRRALDHASSVATAEGVLSYVLLEATESGVFLIAASEEMSLSQKLDCEAQGTGQVVFSASVLRDYVANLPSGSVNIRIEGASGILESGTGAQAEFAGIDPADYPRPAPIEYRGVDLPVEAVRQAVDLVAFACSTDKSRPVLNGVFLDIGGGRVVMSATDGYRLARTEIVSAGPVGSSLKAILSPKSLAVLKRVAEESTVIKVGSPRGGGNGRVGFMLGSIELTVRLIAGVFPDVARVIPAETPTIAIADRLSIIQVIQRVVALAHDQTKRVELHVGGSRIALGGRSKERGAAQDQVPASIVGSAIEIGVNGEYLLRILQKIPGSQVRLSFAGPGRAILVSAGEGALPEGWSSVCLLMPVNNPA